MTLRAVPAQHQWMRGGTLIPVALLACSSFGCDRFDQTTDCTISIFDEADAFDYAEEATISRLFEAQEQNSGDKLALLTISNSAGRDALDIGTERGRLLLKEGCPVAAVLVLAPTDRKAAIAINDMARERLTDEEAATILNNQMIPYFRESDWLGGIRQGVWQIGDELASPDL